MFYNSRKGIWEKFDILSHYLERSKLKRKLIDVKWPSNTNKMKSFAFMQSLEEEYKRNKVETNPRG